MGCGGKEGWDSARRYVLVLMRHILGELILNVIQMFWWFEKCISFFTWMRVNIERVKAIDPADLLATCNFNFSITQSLSFAFRFAPSLHRKDPEPFMCLYVPDLKCLFPCTNWSSHQGDNYSYNSHNHSLTQYWWTELILPSPFISSAISVHGQLFPYLCGIRLTLIQVLTAAIIYLNCGVLGNSSPCCGFYMKYESAGTLFLLDIVLSSIFTK